MTYQHVDEDETVTVVLIKVSNNTLSYDASSAQGGLINVTGKLASRTSFSGVDRRHVHLRSRDEKLASLAGGFSILVRCVSVLCHVENWSNRSSNYYQGQNHDHRIPKPIILTDEPDRREWWFSLRFAVFGAIFRIAIQRAAR